MISSVQIYQDLSGLCTRAVLSDFKVISLKARFLPSNFLGHTEAIALWSIFYKIKPWYLPAVTDLICHVHIILVGGFYSPTNLTQATGGIGSSRLSARSQSQNRFGGSPQTHGLGSHLSRSSALPFLRQNGYAQRSLCVSSLQQGPCQPVVLVTTC